LPIQWDCALAVFSIMVILFLISFVD